jgi:hypothetical protein
MPGTSANWSKTFPIFSGGQTKGKDRKLGFVSLYTDVRGLLVRISKGFHTALNESIASLEALIDAADGVELAAERKNVSATFTESSAHFSSEKKAAGSSRLKP